MYQNTTSAVTFMYKNLSSLCTNYLDNPRGTETPDKCTPLFYALGNFLHCLRLSTSPDKDLPLLAADMVFLGIILANITNMGISVTPNRLQKLSFHCVYLLSAADVSCLELQLILAQNHIFHCCLCLSRPCFHINFSLLHTLCLLRLFKLCPLSTINQSDFCRWRHFLPHYKELFPFSNPHPSLTITYMYYFFP